MSKTFFFFLASVSANFQGRPVVQFNTIVRQETRNLTAASLANIQETAAQMVQDEQLAIEFDNVVMHNIVFLSECTEEEFLRIDEAQPVPVPETVTEVAETEQNNVVDFVPAAEEPFETLSSDGHSPVLEEAAVDGQVGVVEESPVIEEAPAAAEPFAEPQGDDVTGE